MSIHGTIYLIHFSAPIAHACHYIGWTQDLEGRLEAHRKGRGSRLLSACRARSITWEVVRTWEGDRNMERQLKNRAEAKILCPVCRKQKLARKMGLQRARRRGDRP